MRFPYYFLFFFLFLGCTKELEDQLNTLEASNEALKEELSLLSLQLDAYEAQLAILEYQAANPEVHFNSPYVGCWTSSNSVYETEIQILPNGVGTLDFGTAVYQVFSWGVYEGQTILHFGDISWCSCFGVTDQGYLFGEMFEEDQPLAVVDDIPETFSLTDFEDNIIDYQRCVLIQ